MTRQSASWVVVSRATGKAVVEIFNPRNAARIESVPAFHEAFRVVPILEWLQAVNREAALNREAAQ